MMKYNFTITVSGIWDPGAGFLLWGEKADGFYLNHTELKLNLFAEHRESFYGSFLPESNYCGIPVVKLSPSIALSFLAQLPPADFISWQWSSQIASWQKVAPLIKQMVAEGRWLPDYSKWQMGQNAWRLMIPAESITDNGCFFINEWANGVINEITQIDHILNNKSYAGLNFIDEEDWLIAIGWRQDNTPFNTCLQLIEPAAGHSWSLRVWLQDKANADVLVEYQGNDANDSAVYPQAWLNYLDRPGRDIAKWCQLLPELENQKKVAGLKKELTEEAAWSFLTNGSIQLAEAGFTVFLPTWWDELRQQKPRLKFKTKSSVGSAGNSMLGLQQIIQFDWKMAVGDMELSAEEFSQLVAEKKRLLNIGGRWIQLDPSFLQKVQKILKQKKNGLSLGEVLQMHLLAGTTAREGYVLDEAAENYSIPMEIELSGHLAQMMDRLTQADALPINEPPATFHGALRNYQRTGFSWLMFLRNFGLGACLADDMGLGKTIQFIAYLLAVKAESKKPTPSLLICPTSVTGNWQMELKRFGPDLQVYLHYGPQRIRNDKFAAAIEGADIVITTYTLAQIDQEELRSVHWNSICLDEAQNIKNAYTKQATAIRKLKGFHKIAMTGTPMENRLTELWSIMDFLNPGYLGSLGSFKKQFVNVIEKSRDAQAIEQIQRLVRPLLLRRVKNDPAIELDLPEKQEFKEYVTLTAEQASLYENVLADLFERLKKASNMERRGLVLATLTKLKQLCNHPALLLKDRASNTLRVRSTKVERLLAMVEELRAAGDKCLIFTQYVEMGHLLKQVLSKELDEPVLFLHGGTSKNKRDMMIARFQNEIPSNEPPPGIFILSLKAGGTGLNLTAANHVFHIDRWWNPAVENQATDRAHRIGQSRHVQVRKFITLGTLEERINEMIEHKQSLNEMIVGGGEGWITELSTDELREIFALRREWV